MQPGEIIYKINSVKFLGAQEKIAIQILAVYNCRAIEVLRAEWKNFFPGNFLVLKGAKNSNDIIIRDRMILEQINSLPRHDPVKIFSSLTYKYLYKVMKRSFSHLFSFAKTKHNYKVTHGFRYVAANIIQDDEATRTILHHKSKKSQKYYKRHSAESDIVKKLVAKYK